MSASELRERLTFAQRALQSDGFGNNGAVGDFADEFTVAARVAPRLGGEEVFAARLTGRNPAMITVRYSSDTAKITTDWRATNARSGEVWNIRSAIATERKDFIEMLAEKGVAT